MSSSSSTLALLSSLRYLEHDPGPHHPESPQRLRAILEHLRQIGLSEKLVHLAPEAHDIRWIHTIHDPQYVERVRRACEQGETTLDTPDVGISSRSFEVAMLAVDGALTLVDAVMEGKVRRGFGLIRPPGHHAEADHAMGFCLFNNVAIAARYAREKYQLKKIAIVDWDIHHGNGTQHAFDTKPDFLYISIHQWPLYPGSGRRHEKGKGNIINIPLDPEAGDSEYLQVFQEEVIPALSRFQPELILISAGFDAHRSDPLASMEVTETGFRQMTQLTVGVAEKFAQGRIVSLLEGGYHLPSLARSVAVHLEALLGV